jgi:hypothetical protein
MVNGKPGRVDPPAIELQIVETVAPQVAISYIAQSKYEVNLETKEYVQVWDVVEAPLEIPSFDTETVMRVLIKKVDGETLSEEEEMLLTLYKQQTSES